MNVEENIISLISEQLPRSKKQLNELFQSDAEILKKKNGFMLFSVDDFSKEDHFRATDPFQLGKNLAVATLSDIFASGGVPQYFSHSVALNPAKWDNSYLIELSRGVAEILMETGAAFIGGDLGTSDEWHYTGIAIGHSDKPLMRKKTAPGELIYMTGNCGTGNLEAALQLFDLDSDITTQFELRHKEARLIQEFATTCIDSSDGIVNALRTISSLNNIGFLIDRLNPDPIASAFMAKLKLPEELLFLGECGEYELVFTIKPEDEKTFLSEAESRELNFAKIGTIQEEKKVLLSGSAHYDLSDFNIGGRDFADPKEYIFALTKYLQSHENKIS
ncbi:AIR synthase related protein [Draconibacterium sp. IB214405]|uniref:AIR synthase related protein n=1 Tax=Draconibacterium sp. IB214405 TaxID=3097352 RepID=UPI002A0BF929|nr:AIR synthase related protein [Draconibacterium sp. IB214405]MDX8340333.1 AIR synthase related protein [Draconibacterium sp. IB214405]